MKMYPHSFPIFQKTSAAFARRFHREDDIPGEWKLVDRQVSRKTNENLSMKAKILIVDDEPNVRLMFRSALELIGLEVFEADSGDKALDQCLTREHNVALVDLRMPGGMDGLELLQEMVNLKIRTPVIMISAHGEIPNVVSAMKLGAIDFLKKPILPEELRHVVKDVLIRHEPEEAGKEANDLDNYLRRAKRAINLRDFDFAKSELIKALEINPDCPQAINLAGVMLEMREEYDEAARGQAPAFKGAKTSSAHRILRRFFNMFHSGNN